MHDGTIGDIRLFAGSAAFFPHTYAPCDGRALNMSQNTALLSLIGTRFGADGVRTFNLPTLPGPATQLSYLICTAGIYPLRP